MGIVYKKENINKNKRISPRGPRDSQRRANASPDTDAVNELTSRVNQLSSQLSEVTPTPVDSMSPEQLDNVIINAVKAETGVIKNEYELKISKIKLENEDLKNKISIIKESTSTEIKNLKSQIDSKDKLIVQFEDLKNDDTIKDMILELKNKINNISSTDQGISDRPVLEDMYIDPSCDKEEGRVLHIDIKDVPSETKEDMSDKVNKLKALMGKLPNKV